MVGLPKISFVLMKWDWLVKNEYGTNDKEAVITPKTPHEQGKNRGLRGNYKIF